MTTRLEDIFMTLIRTMAVLCLSLVASSAFAQTAPAPTIKDQMQDIKSLFKAITASVNDKSKDETNAGNATQIAALFTAAQSLVPAAINKMPADQQAAAVADYKRLIQEEIDQANALAKAFVNDDTTSANNIINQMNVVKKEGHGKYNPN